jgi:DivIVA domain-containing protein
VDAADVELPTGPLQPEDLRAVRFALAVRGYRMDEVDRVIERAATELAERDRRILELEQAKTDNASVAAPAATVVLSEPPTDEPMAGDTADADDAVEDEPAVTAESAAPVVPIEPPLETPPAPPEPPSDEAEEPEATGDAETSEEQATADASTVATVTDGSEATPEAADEDVAREPVASLLGEDADEAETSTALDEAASSDEPADDSEPAGEETDVDTSEPPPPPPVEVAVVRTEVAPLPSGTALPTPVDDASAEGAPTKD